jgi:phage repressor protein C with HTH and peptisase S24 domain
LQILQKSGTREGSQQGRGSARLSCWFSTLIDPARAASRKLRDQRFAAGLRPIDTDTTMADCSLLEPYALQVLGDSMEPEFPEKCIVIIEPVNTCGDGAFVFVEVEGVRWFRQLREDQQGNRWLQAINDLYPSIDLQGLEYKILGVIVQKNIKRSVTHYKHFPRREDHSSPLH